MAISSPAVAWPCVGLGLSPPSCVELHLLLLTAKKLFFPLTLWKAKDKFDSQEANDKTHLYPCKWFEALKFWVMKSSWTPTSQLGEYTLLPSECDSWYTALKNHNTPDRESGKQYQPSRKTERDWVGDEKGKTANIWKSFQLWRKETKCRGHYFNFLQFSALGDAQEILYANSLFLKSWKILQN